MYCCAFLNSCYIPCPSHTPLFARYTSRDNYAAPSLFLNDQQKLLTIQATWLNIQSPYILHTTYIYAVSYDFHTKQGLFL
jgi:hypothetical protein